MSKKIYDYSNGSTYKTVFEFNNVMVYMPSTIGMNLLSVLSFDFLEEYMDYNMHKISRNLYIFRSESEYFTGIDKWLNRLNSIIIQPDTEIDFMNGITKVHFGDLVLECPIKLVDKRIQAIYKVSEEETDGDRIFAAYILANDWDDPYDDPDCIEYNFAVDGEGNIYEMLVNGNHRKDSCRIGFSYLDEAIDVINRIR